VSVLDHVKLGITGVRVPRLDEPRRRGHLAHLVAATAIQAEYSATRGEEE
jgi:hypothetical protein